MTRLPSPSNHPNTIQLPVFEGRCPHLQETGETILLNHEDLPQGISFSGLQRSKHDGILWMISEKHRIAAFCYCLKCDEIFNGSGGNIATHVRRHGRRRVFTQPERHKAFFYFVLMHNVGFSATRDPVTEVFHINSSIVSVR